MMNKILIFITISMAITAMASTAFANPPKPPAEAFAACANSSQGAACQVATKRGELLGICRIPPQQDQLVCVPKKHERGAREGNSKGKQPENTADNN